ncbi:Panacea domain-containing protein [Photobacterium damselae]|uniref:Panacea domain-containing protein n=1 Tax=Photobacterium damselae TaxID=38293 RepID=UPI0040675BED
MKMYHTYSGLDVASCVLRLAQNQGKQLTNLQLQKLVYASHGFSLAQLKRPLIIDDVYAWMYGPVIPSVYFQYKQYGSGVISYITQVSLDSESESLIDGVVSLLGHIPGPQLITMTHQHGGPWCQVWDGSTERVIPDSIICEHYSHILNTQSIYSL